MGVQGGYDPDDDDDNKGAGTKRKITDWDCPACNANNPSGDPIKDGDEQSCNYCGTTYLMKISDEGKLKLKEM